jgi:porphobilinogen synthase
MNIPIRPRRMRKSEALRNLTQETQLNASDFVLPLFIHQGEHKEEIASMPGCYRLSLKDLEATVTQCLEFGVRSFALFPKIKESDKDALASLSAQDNFYLKAISHLKSKFKNITLFTDVAMDPYSSDGHDGVVKDGKIINDETLPILAKMAVMQAQAGADFVSPSDMMDGRVAYIRRALDEHGYTDCAIMSYSAKYASAFYGPFRDALESAPKAGDKKTYQMNPANKRVAKREVLLDLAEGADMIMVKPALGYLDIISQSKELSDVPVAAYFVSGEYAMIKAAGKLGYLDEKAAMLEAHMSVKRAGADVIFTYAALDIVKELRVN